MSPRFDWEMCPVPSMETVRGLGKSLNRLPEALARALVVRGIDSFEEARLFFRGSLESLEDPTAMKDMDKAVQRVIRAIDTKERVVIYGDYDVDGTTATALMTDFLRSRGVPAAYFIPDRFRHGYGLCTTGIDEVREMGASLIIALDCGITAIDEAAYIRDLGMDLVICDHHTPAPAIPDAVAVLDPKREDCDYAFRELCGCGVAFKLALAVALRRGEPEEAVHGYLDLVALATAADVVPLRGENRILLREGLRRIRTQARLGIRCLADEAQVDLSQCDTRAIQFALAPRINAAGRLGDAKRAVKLLLATEEPEARKRAKELEKTNMERRALDQQVLETAISRTETLLLERDRRAVVLFDRTWHLGVIGIVAARLVERFNRPFVLLGEVNGTMKGSARSVAGINIYDALRTCSHLLLGFGGHDYAAGLSMDPDHLDAFADQMDAAVEAATSDAAFVRKLRVDAEVGLPDIDQRFWAVLEQFAPFGEDNAAPIFVSRDIKLTGQPALVGRTGDHLKFRVHAPGAGSLDVIGFGLGGHLETLEEAMRENASIDLAFSVDENNWNGRRSLQLVARDLRRNN